MAQPRIEVTLKIDDKKVTLEGPEDFVRKEVERLTRSSDSGVETKKQIANLPPSDSATHGLSEREFVSSKRPHGHHEMVTVLGFLLTESGVSEFSDDDIRRAYIRAGIRPPKVVAQALRDAKSKYDLIEQGSKRGMYRLSPHGDRTVRFDLPRKGKSGEEVK